MVPHFLSFLRQATSIGGVVINSGCANACTGEQGLRDARTMMRLASDAGIANSLVMSTGVIGPFLPMDKIQLGLTSASQALTSAPSGWESASRAIMTTDTVPKLLSRSFELSPGKTFTIAGMCKGAGMIHPNMATMLGVLTTDAAVSADCLKAATHFAVDRSFNAISVDGDMSTNDTVAVLANGQSPALGKADAIASVSHPSFAVFQSALTAFAIELSQKLVRDGEGATKFVTVEVLNGATFAEARTVASSIATSALVKTAMYGQDANWGRIVCAVGYAGVDVDPAKVSLWFVDDGNDSPEGNLHLLKDGQPYQTDEERATELVRRSDIHIRIDLGKGHEHATMWTCDFSSQHALTAARRDLLPTAFLARIHVHVVSLYLMSVCGVRARFAFVFCAPRVATVDYVKINADYRS